MAKIDSELPLMFEVQIQNANTKGAGVEWSAVLLRVSESATDRSCAD